MELAPLPHTHVSVYVDLEVVDSGGINEQEHQVERTEMLGKTAPEGGIPAVAREEENTRDGHVPPHHTHTHARHVTAGACVYLLVSECLLCLTACGHLCVYVVGVSAY